MCDLRQGIQCNVLGIVGIDITLRQSTFLGQLEGGVRDDGQILLPGNIYQKHLEQSVAHLFKAGKFVANSCIISRAKLMNCFYQSRSYRSCIPSDCPALHRKKKMQVRPHRIRYIPWDRWEVFFRVLYIGIDDDQIIRLHRHLFVLYIEGALAPQDIEQF